MRRGWTKPEGHVLKFQTPPECTHCELRASKVARTSQRRTPSLTIRRHPPWTSRVTGYRRAHHRPRRPSRLPHALAGVATRSRSSGSLTPSTAPCHPGPLDDVDFTGPLSPGRMTLVRRAPSLTTRTDGQHRNSAQPRLLQVFEAPSNLHPPSHGNEDRDKPSRDQEHCRDDSCHRPWRLRWEE